MNRIVKCASCSDTITVDEHSSIRDYICSERCANNDLWNKAKEERLGYFQIGREEGRREILEKVQDIRRYASLPSDRLKVIVISKEELFSMLQEFIKDNTPPKGGE